MKPGPTAIDLRADRSEPHEAARKPPAAPPDPPLSAAAERRTKGRNHRIDIRFDKLFPVTVSSEIFGDTAGIARNVSCGGVLVELGDLLPLGAVVVVRFRMPGGPGELALRAEVKHHYCLNYETQGARPEPRCVRAVGLRFVEMSDDDLHIMHGALPAPPYLH